METNRTTISEDELVDLEDVEHRLSDKMEAMLDGDITLNIEKIEYVAERFGVESLIGMIGRAVIEELKEEGIDLDSD